MKRILITAYDLNIGGIERALINLLKNIHNKYDITLALEHKKGELLDQIPKDVNIIEYKVESNGNFIIRKLKNFIKYIKWVCKYKNKFDFSICYATYSIPGKKIALCSSKKNAIWIHTNYKILYGDNKKTMEFFKLMDLRKFRKCIFVSEEALNDAISVYPEIASKSIFCNNYVDVEDILKKSKEPISLKKDKTITFINVSRHDESSKKITRIIKAAQMLSYDNLNFRIIMIGDGPDHSMYVDMVKDYGLTKKILFLGSKKNPFPYYKMSDCVVLSSDYEGFPVVFLESLVLEKDIISTKVSDYKNLKRYITFVEKNEKSLYIAMKKYIEGNLKKTNLKYDIRKLNSEIDKKIDYIIGGE